MCVHAGDQALRYTGHGLIPLEQAPAWYAGNRLISGLG